MKPAIGVLPQPIREEIQGTTFGRRAICVQHFATGEISPQVADAKTRGFNVLQKDRKLPRSAATQVR
jgi:hypothetical protein